MPEEENSILVLIISLLMLVAWGFSVLSYNKYPILEPFLFVSLPLIASSYLSYSYVREEMHPDREEMMNSSNKVCRKSHIGLLKKFLKDKDSIKKSLIIALVISAGYLISNLLYIPLSSEIAGKIHIFYSFSIVTFIGFLFPVSFYLFIHLNTNVYLDNETIKYIDFQYGKLIADISRLEEVKTSGKYIIINSKEGEDYYIPVKEPEKVRDEILVRKI